MRGPCLGSNFKRLLSYEPRRLIFPLGGVLRSWLMEVSLLKLGIGSGTTTKAKNLFKNKANEPKRSFRRTTINFVKLIS